MLIALHKPYGVICQFSSSSSSKAAGEAGDPEPTLADHVKIKDIYPAGRLDKNSEGLLLLTDDGELQHRISHPDSGTQKEYWVQLEGKPDAAFASTLCAGAKLADGHAAARKARPLDTAEDQAAIKRLGPHPGNLPEHRSHNSGWYAITLTSGRNRVVRRLCAALGHPVLRLVRIRIGAIELLGLAAGETRSETWQ